MMREEHGAHLAAANAAAEEAAQALARGEAAVLRVAKVLPAEAVLGLVEALDAYAAEKTGRPLAWTEEGGALVGRPAQPPAAAAQGGAGGP